MAGKNKDYKMRSIIKSVVFFVIAAVVILFMRKDAGSTDPNAHESTQAVETQYMASTTQAFFTTVPETTSQDETQTAANGTHGISPQQSEITVAEDGEYSDKDHVALYIHMFGKLPQNYITKTKAQKSGYVKSEGNLWDVLPGKSIGGGPFSNNEGLLPEKEGRSYKECDIDYNGGTRNAKRIVYSNDGLIYYTEDHYNTFELLYGDE